MRIPLDYYRILGLPPEASTSDLEKVQRDRTASMPRREYSDAAIESRNRLIQKAARVLTDPEKRQAYIQTIRPTNSQAVTSADAENSAAGSELDSSANVVTAPPTLEIDDRDFAGALLLLYELGEYEQILAIAQPYINLDKSNFQADQSSNDPDVILTVALADLELGRQSWKQGQYEAAAQSLESSQGLLLREGLFLTIRSEIQADLFRLRPYRILELLAAGGKNAADHRQGLLLLKEMLDARRGIDGSGNDYSGLNIDDFLRFIQQLRGYMTTEEQQLLFEEEAKRPSLVASYLAVYALIARGFSQSQPALIRRAKGLLVRLSSRQDVQLEQAVCALLLGQTEEASSVIELSGEAAQIDFIRRNSEGSPDLLPGLCLYTERWLQEEVYPHFKDLIDRQVYLKSYFADEQVQAYLEELPNAVAAGTSSEWTVEGISSSASTTTATNPWQRDPASSNLPSNANNATAARRPTSPPDKVQPRRPANSKPASVNSTNGSSIANRSSSNGRSSSPNSHSPTNQRLTTSPKTNRQSGATRNGKRSSLNGATGVGGNLGNPNRTKPTPLTEEVASPAVKKVAARKRRKNVQTGRFLILAVASLGMLAVIVSLAAWGWRSLITPPAENSFAQLETPLLPLSDTVSQATDSIDAAPGPIDSERASQLIESWQVVKSKALGKEYDIDALAGILTEPELSQWRDRAEQLERRDSYLQYIPNSVEVQEVLTDGEDRATVVAEILETRNFFSSGNLDPTASKTDSNYQVEYDLVREDDKWLIERMIVRD
ncbi:heat shock protein DnaJ domain protein [Thalassoporum mexicanum PCC 7367]|uniref:IMS domain-containing protein n=1 Tax=Thalassoporum mexicanum TaxID=3457544 RepID=UPI00029FC7C7|nr:IMS domain-containing protein [Pseudanabaena sp. PCC 7367]AFY69790.1 heat shock protein DnaJ domain protein [Pseudanabaena sp. PCC 7367]